MRFRDLPVQYLCLKDQIDRAVTGVMKKGDFIHGASVTELEQKLSLYVGTKNCVTCANGTDALLLALMCWNIGPGDAVFVPDFTFFSTAEVVSFLGAVPVFVDVDDTFNMDAESLQEAVEAVEKEGKLIPRAIIAVDLFGQPADYPGIRKIADEYGLKLLEDGAQGFGGEIDGRKACGFGDISTTSFFPAKPLGCYGDGGAVFTDNEEWAALLSSLKVHGKGSGKYDNVRIGMNSRLDTLQAAILLVKLEAFCKYELEAVNEKAALYTEQLKAKVQTPLVKDGFLSSWAQYSILLEEQERRDGLKQYLAEKEIPSMVYYPKPLHEQEVYKKQGLKQYTSLIKAASISQRVLSLPMHPYLEKDDIVAVCTEILYYLK